MLIARRSRTPWIPVGFWSLVALTVVLLLLVASGLAGCSTARISEQRNEQVPGEAWYLEIDTRPAPAPQAMLPVHRALVMAAMGLPDEPTKVPIKVTAPDGSEVLLPADFPGVLRFGSAKGQDASTAAPPGGGGSAYAKATTIIGSKIKAPPKGVAIIFAGAIIVAVGVGFGVTGRIKPLTAWGIAAAGGTLLALGWLVDSPLMGWMVALAVLALLGAGGLLLYNAMGDKSKGTALVAITKAVNKAPPGDYEKIKAEVADAAGKDADRVEREVKKAKKKHNIVRKVAVSG